MGQLLGEYIQNSWLDLIFSIFIGFIPALVLIKKNPNSVVDNNTKISETIEEITVIVKQTEIKNKDNNGYNIFLLLIAVAFASLFFIRHYDVILDIYASIIVVVITATLAIAIKLYINNQYDHLNRFWTVILLTVTFFNFFSLSVMIQLDLSNTDDTSLRTIFNSVGMSGIHDYINRTIGFTLALMLNILSIILLFHIISVNYVLFKKNSLLKWFVKYTTAYTKPKFLIFIIIIFAPLSLLLTSGLLIELLDTLNNF